jgi:hypothetical protein
MRLTIELDDIALRNAVEAQVGKAVSEMAEAHIKRVVDDIVNKKLDRDVFPTADACMKAVAKEAFDAVIKQTYSSRAEMVRTSIKEAAFDILKQGIK